MTSSDDSDALGVSIGAQIEEVEYELKMRADVYHRRVYMGRMRQSQAEEHIRRMRAVLFTLKNLQSGAAKGEAK